MRLTRLHVRYDAVSFPEDLIFVEIGDRANFQDRYIMRHPAVIGQSCLAAEAYRAELPARLRREAQTLADVTGWPRSRRACGRAASRSRNRAEAERRAAGFTAKLL